MITSELISERFSDTFPKLSKNRKLAGEILSSGEVVAFTSGSFLYNEGDSCSGIGLFLSGEVRVYKESGGGREITLYEIFHGETCILNASCILSRTRYPAVALAVADGEIILLEDSTFRKLVADYEEMRGFVFRLFSSRLSIMTELIEEVAFGRMNERLSDYLIERSEDGKLAITHQQIANDLGTSREVVSRLLKEFEKGGRVVLSRGKIELISIL